MTGPIHRELLTAGALFLSLVVLCRRRALKLVIEFFTAKTHPLNLAVFRLVLFLLLLWPHLLDPLGPINSTSSWYTEVPSELIVPPSGIRFVLKRLHVDPASLIQPHWVKASCVLVEAFCFTGLIGLFSRTSAFLVAVFGFYAWAIPEFYGKVDHNHHRLWFALLLAASPCGDALSCDALFALWRGAAPRAAALSYGLPLRFVWLLIGIIYFFPGFWKIWHNGLDWAFSDNLKNMMYANWFYMDWRPAFRLDRYPLLCHIGGLLTVVFEMSFIFLIFFTTGRYLALIGALFFHFMTWLVLGIVFWELPVLYGAALIDWHFIISHITPRFREKEQPMNLARHGLYPLMTWAVGGVLIVGNLLFGIREDVSAYPFACYPTFSGIVKEPRAHRIVCFVSADGEEFTPTDPAKEIANAGLMPFYRFHALFGSILDTQDAQKRAILFDALWRLVERAKPSFRKVRVVRFYADTLSADPERDDDRPVRRDLLFEWVRQTPNGP
jgi:hypothetical protein